MYYIFFASSIVKKYIFIYDFTNPLPFDRSTIPNLKARQGRSTGETRTGTPAKPHLTSGGDRFLLTASSNRLSYTFQHRNCTHIYKNKNFTYRLCSAILQREQDIHITFQVSWHTLLFYLFREPQKLEKRYYSSIQRQSI